MALPVRRLRALDGTTAHRVTPWQAVDRHSKYLVRKTPSLRPSYSGVRPCRVSLMTTQRLPRAPAAPPPGSSPPIRISRPSTTGSCRQRSAPPDNWPGACPKRCAQAGLIRGSQSVRDPHPPRYRPSIQAYFRQGNIGSGGRYPAAPALCYQKSSCGDLLRRDSALASSW